MNRSTSVAAAAAFISSLVTIPAVTAWSLTDVPSGHWATGAVKAVIANGVMDAPGGKFDGGRKVTRIDMANTLARFAKALERGAWQPSSNSPTASKQPSPESWAAAPVNRYELASVLDRVGRNAAQGLPTPAGKTFGTSDALPAASVDKIPKSNRAYSALAYLVKNHMLWGDTVLLKPTEAPVTGKDVVMALTMTVAGVADRLTDEPQNRVDLGEPPAHKHDK